MIVQRSIRTIGWSIIVISSILILSEIGSLLLSTSMGQANELLGTMPQLQSSSLTPMLEIAAYARIWSIYSIFYFLLVITGAILFIQFRSLGRRILEICCWIGLFNALVDTLLGYFTWKSTEDTLSSLLGSSAMRGYDLNPIGIATMVFGVVLWILPSVGMLAFLRRSDVKDIMNNHPPVASRNSSL